MIITFQNHIYSGNIRVINLLNCHDRSMHGIIDAAPLISIQKIYADFYQLRIWQNEWRSITVPLCPFKRVNI